MNLRFILVKVFPEDTKVFRFFGLIGIRINAKIKRKKLTELSMFINITHHCNLNCKCCTAFSPISSEFFLEIGSFRRDMQKLAELTDNHLAILNFSGGEPLLHPEINEFCYTARKLFPKAQIGIISNGILIPQMPDSFFYCLKECQIGLSISRYPIKIDTKKMLEFDIHFNYTGGNVPVKSLWKYPLDLKGKQPKKNSFDICSQINACMCLEDGYIYPCNTIALIKSFNDFFDQNLQISDNDKLDLHKTTDINEIFNFLCTPKPFCRYCNRKAVKFGIKHDKSKMEISEWT